MDDLILKINNLVDEKFDKKRDFISRLSQIIEQNGDTPPAEKTLYAKLSSSRGLDVWLLPYIAATLGIPEQDLFDPSKREKIAREEIEKSPMRFANILPEIQHMADMVRLPYVTVGAGAEAIADTALMESVYIPSDILPARFDLRHVIMARVLGDSMEPRYSEGDLLFIDMVDGRDVILPDGIYLVRYGDTVQIKTIQFLGNGDIRVISFNDAYPPIQPKQDLGVDWEIIGKPFLHWKAEMSTRLEEK